MNLSLIGGLLHLVQNGKEWASVSFFYTKQHATPLAAQIIYISQLQLQELCGLFVNRIS